jgi:serine/threonine protein kinase
MSRVPSIGLCSGQDRLRNIHLEVAILHDLSHENIVRIHELIELEMQVVIIMSHASSTTLLQYIQEKRRFTGGWFFPENIAWSIFRQLVSGVIYLHDHQTIHHNLTLDNILFDTNRERIVIKGFSIADIVSSGDTFVGRPKFINPYFTAPEVLAGSQSLLAADSVYEEGKVDVFSCGVILVILVSDRSRETRLTFF